MKYLSPVFPVVMCISLIFALALFVAGTLVFLASQAFYEIHNYSGSLVAYFAVIFGVMIFSYLAYKIITIGFCYCANANKKKAQAKSEADAGPNAKVLLTVLAYEGLKLYLNKKNKK